jgi:predicted XRE-type DNA-binding protein
MAKLPIIQKGSGNVFADLGLPNADELLLKASIVSEVANAMKLKKLTQTKAAALTGVSQPDLSNLLRGRTQGFSVERLMLMLTKLGSDVEVTVRPTVGTKKQGGIKFRRMVA